MNKGNPKALLPILVFLVLYLGFGILFEYVLDISMGFYQIPIVVIFLVAIIVACCQNKSLSLDQKIGLMGKGAGDKTIMYMVFIFLLAGVFVGTVGRGSAESCAYLMLSFVPVEYAAGVLFVVACFVSLAMGTSCGTITLIVPIAYTVAVASGISIPLCVGAVIGGAMFGDNLSFISDTTIAACQGQGVPMKDKFRENFKIALPAAIVSLIIIIFIGFGQNVIGTMDYEYDLVTVIPYILVLFFAIVGINVFIVLLIGIVSGSIVVLVTGAVAPINLLANMGSGAAGMFETTMVALLVASMGALIKEYGGFDALLYAARKVCRGRKAGQLGIGILVGFMDIATANNTVAIVMANPVASEMSRLYGISKRKTASLLDTFSCIFQGILPYGAQMLLALSAVATMGGMTTAFEILPFMIYPFMLLISSLVFIFLIPGKKDIERACEDFGDVAE